MLFSDLPDLVFGVAGFVSTGAPTARGTPTASKLFGEMAAFELFFGVRFFDTAIPAAVPAATAALCAPSVATFLRATFLNLEVLDFGATFLTEPFLSGDLRVTVLFEGNFRVTDFFAAVFLTVAAFFAAVFLTVAAFFTGVFLIEALFTGVFLTVAVFLTATLFTGLFLVAAAFATLLPAAFATLLPVVFPATFATAKALLLSTTAGRINAPTTATLTVRVSHFLLIPRGDTFFWSTSIWIFTFHS